MDFGFKKYVSGLAVNLLGEPKDKEDQERYIKQEEAKDELENHRNKQGSGKGKTKTL